jgi:hypothetical protein
MSYHDGYIGPKHVGISVVNPLHRIESKLAKIRRLIEDIARIEKMKKSELKEAIEEIING